MRYAETGVSLEVDLSRGTVEKVKSDPRLTELYLGGLGINAKIAWDRVPPETTPFSPENVLIFGPGLLVGTLIPGANRTVVSSFTPVNNFFAFSMMGGFWGAELKHAGYDRIVIRGKAPELVYLWIKNDKVELRDARHLRGKGTYETTVLLQEELGDKRFQIVCIGPAGENRVYMASVNHNWATAARGGLGAVMGDKNLKAIAVRGTKDIFIARPREFFEAAMRLRREIHNNPNLGDWMAYTDDDRFHHDHFAWGNARVRRKGYWNEEIERRWTDLRKRHMDRQIGCYNCPKRCIIVISWPGRPRFGYKCFAKDTYHMAAFEELDFSYDILPVAHEYGLDAYSTPQVIAFALELYEAGILTDRDLPGMPSDTRGRFFYLLEKIAHREGIGDVLANGVYWAARQIGRGAEQYDHNTIKKIEQVPIKLGKLNPIYFLMWATNEKWNITQIEGAWPQDPLPTKQQRKDFVREWVAVPDEKFKRWFLQWEKREIIPVEAACAIVDWSETMHYIDNSLGLCGFLSSFRGQFGGIPGPDKLLGAGPAYHIHNIPRLINLATGMDCDEQRLWEIAKRSRTLIRAINVRRGLRREDDSPPEDHWAVRDPEIERKLFDEYYRLKGWDERGIPTEETLRELGLDYVADDLKRRVIL